MSKKIRAIYNKEGQIKFFDEAPRGNFEVIIIFPDKGFCIVKSFLVILF